MHSIMLLPWLMLMQLLNEPLVYIPLVTGVNGGAISFSMERSTFVLWSRGCDNITFLMLKTFSSNITSTLMIIVLFQGSNSMYDFVTESYPKKKHLTNLGSIFIC